METAVQHYSSLLFLNVQKTVMLIILTCISLYTREKWSISKTAGHISGAAL